MFCLPKTAWPPTLWCRALIRFGTRSKILAGLLNSEAAFPLDPRRRLTRGKREWREGDNFDCG